jgi:hypothetical protein
MERKDHSGRRAVNSYQLSAWQLADLHSRYGRPGEISPGKPAPKKRNRLDAALDALDRKDGKGALPLSDYES